MLLKLLRTLSGAREAAPSAAPPAPVTPAGWVQAPGADAFDVAAHLTDAHGLPVLDWDAARRWVEAIPGEAAQGSAWSACERAWLEHLCAALGPGYRLREQGPALLLSSLPDKLAAAALSFVNKTLQRVVSVLDGIAAVPAWGSTILVLFDDEDSYYRYVAHYYPEAGEFAGSGGMYIHAGCGHFVTVKAELQALEPVIAHELTHACLSHLPIPAWLNEGLAVNTEQRLCPPHFSRDRSTPQQMHARHRSFWGAEEVQQFWSGKSFLRADEGNELSYDLARIIVAQFAAEWSRFRPFVLAAQGEDGGAAAAADALGLDLGDVVSSLLEQPPSPRWAPDPAAWHSAPERGAF